MAMTLYQPVSTCFSRNRVKCEEHLRNTGQQNAGQLNLSLAGHLQRPQHGNGNAKEQKVTKQRHRRVDAVHQTPLQAGIARSNGLPSVRPVARHRLAVEDEEEDLGQEASNQDAKHNLDGQQKVVVQPADAVVKRQTRDAAQQQGRRVDDVGDKVQHLRLQDGGDVEHIFDVSKVSSRAQVDELDTEANKDDQEGLPTLQRQHYHLHCQCATTVV